MTFRERLRRILRLHTRITAGPQIQTSDQSTSSPEIIPTGTMTLRLALTPATSPDASGDEFKNILELIYNKRNEIQQELNILEEELRKSPEDVSSEILLQCQFWGQTLKDRVSLLEVSHETLNELLESDNLVGQRIFRPLKAVG